MRPPHRMLIAIVRRQWFQLRFRYRIYETASFTEALQENPLSLITISPREINRMMVPGKELYREYTPGSVVGGDWDQQTKPFIESIYYRSLKQRFIDGDNWEQTPLYESAINREPGRYYHGCKTPQEVLGRLHRLEEIYESMRVDGYLTQRELRRTEHRSSTKPHELGEIRINIDRSGNPIFDDGRHRFAMAKLLDIDEIPAIVIGRHRDWWKQDGRMESVLAT